MDLRMIKTSGYPSMIADAPGVRETDSGTHDIFFTTA